LRLFFFVFKKKKYGKTNPLAGDFFAGSSPPLGGGGSSEEEEEEEEEEDNAFGRGRGNEKNNANAAKQIPLRGIFLRAQAPLRGAKAAWRCAKMQREKMQASPWGRGCLGGMPNAGGKECKNRRGGYVAEGEEKCGRRTALG
jgi:hypothetical protein